MWRLRRCTADWSTRGCVGGKNVAPEVLEDRVRVRWLIADCVVAGDRRPYVAALVTLDGAAFARWKQREGKPLQATVGDLHDDPDLLAVVQQAVDQASAAVSRAEGIKRLRILDAVFTVGDELTLLVTEHVLRRGDERRSIGKGRAAASRRSRSTTSGRTVRRPRRLRQRPAGWKRPRGRARLDRAVW